MSAKLNKKFEDSPFKCVVHPKVCIQKVHPKGASKMCIQKVPLIISSPEVPSIQSALKIPPGTFNVPRCTYKVPRRRYYLQCTLNVLQCTPKIRKIHTKKVHPIMYSPCLPPGTLIVLPYGTNMASTWYTPKRYTQKRCPQKVLTKKVPPRGSSSSSNLF